jgi:hypothetical protein
MGLLRYFSKLSPAVTGAEVVHMARKTASFAQFFYRVNPDSTIESICGFCFDASAAMIDRAKLQLWEANHQCAGYGSRGLCA